MTLTKIAHMNHNSGSQQTLTVSKLNG